MARIRGASFGDLSGELLRHIANFMPKNEVACTFRLVNKAAAASLRDCGDIHLSQLVPEHAFAKHWASPDAMLGVSLQQRHHLLVLTARSGSLANLKVALEAAGCCLVHEVFDAAAACGSEEMCQWLADQSCPMGEKAVITAAEAGNLEVLRLLLFYSAENFPAHLYDLSKAACGAAAAANQRAVCEGLLGDQAPGHHLCLLPAVRNGHKQLSEWLLQLPDVQAWLPDPVAQLWLVTAAARGFDLPALQQVCATHLEPDFLGQIFRHCAGEAAAAALVSPTPDWRLKVQWLQAQGALLRHAPSVDWDDLLQRPDWLERLQLLAQQRGAGQQFPKAAGLVAAAIREARVPVLQYLLEHRLAVLTKAHSKQAAESGNVALLGELLALGCPIGSRAARVAAAKGHLHVLQWLAGPEAGQAGEAALRKARPILTACAAESGSVEVMRWLRAVRGCPWDMDTFAAAAKSGNTALLEFIVAEGCPMEGDTPYLEAAINNDVVMLRFLRQRLGCPLNPHKGTFNRAVSGGSNMEVLRWLLLEGGCPVDWGEAARRAKERGRHFGGLEVQLWIVGHVLMGAALSAIQEGEEAGEGRLQQSLTEALRQRFDVVRREGGEGEAA